MRRLSPPASHLIKPTLNLLPKIDPSVSKVRLESNRVLRLCITAPEKLLSEIHTEFRNDTRHITEKLYENMTNDIPTIYRFLLYCLSINILKENEISKEDITLLRIIIMQTRIVCVENIQSLNKLLSVNENRVVEEKFEQLSELISNRLVANISI